VKWEKSCQRKIHLNKLPSLSFYIEKITLVISIKNNSQEILSISINLVGVYVIRQKSQIVRIGLWFRSKALYVIQNIRIVNFADLIGCVSLAVRKRTMFVLN